ncbi:hypothetical protein DB345_00475 [Spartobacteria bacterium LR76]|nr:hypothetical protein DB345_00475 [Spartobacteria bacterium LR76]
MKSHPLVLLLGLLSCATAALPAAEITVTSAPEASENNVAVSNIDQATEFEPVQARWRNWDAKETGKPEATDRRGVSQMFTWPTTQGLKSLGLRTDAFEHALNRGIVSPQKWAIDIQKLNESGDVVDTVATLPVQLNPGDYRRGEYLVFTFTPAINLVEGGRYGFHLRPESIVDGQRLYFSRTAAGSAQKLGGGAVQTPGTKLTRYHQQSGEGQQYDLIFFLDHE